MYYYCLDVGVVGIEVAVRERGNEELEGMSIMRNSVVEVKK
jgi:hypothetical protein